MCPPTNDLTMLRMLLVMFYNGDNNDYHVNNKGSNKAEITCVVSQSGGGLTKRILYVNLEGACSSGEFHYARIEDMQG